MIAQVRRSKGVLCSLVKRIKKPAALVVLIDFRLKTLKVPRVWTPAPNSLRDGKNHNEGIIFDSIMGSDLLSKHAQLIAVQFTAFAAGEVTPLLAMFLATCLSYVLHK
ncbi:hypothetical protein MXM51_16665 [Pantoea stewartii]|uniref:hypothetical protein n=1 Tax=Pantoea stewartii TaxID=66269 RepID=UPI002DB94332|nr:hypothetical protein [Pantoea stewartii]MEB6536158.1 hypothetical protein [Pantoea stewartii]